MANQRLLRIKLWLQSLSFRTGIWIVVVCLLCYTISFAQMLLPISITAKGVIWTMFFGLAKTAQYSAILILGKAGIERLKKYLSPRRTI